MLSLCKLYVSKCCGSLLKYCKITWFNLNCFCGMWYYVGWSASSNQSRDGEIDGKLPKWMQGFSQVNLVRAGFISVEYLCFGKQKMVKICMCHYELQANWFYWEGFSPFLHIKPSSAYFLVKIQYSLKAYACALICAMVDGEMSKHFFRWLNNFSVVSNLRTFKNQVDF